MLYVGQNGEHNAICGGIDWGTHLYVGQFGK